MTEQTCKVSLETQSVIFNRALKSQTTQTASDLSRSLSKEKGQHVDLTKSAWLFIANERDSLDILKPFIFERVWDDVENYFLEKRRLHLFVEEPIIGLVSKEGKFWLFFEPETAEKFFHKQQERPKGFNRSKITAFPFLDILPALTQEVHLILKESDKRVMAQIKKLEEVLGMADVYLTPDNTKRFVKTIKKVIQSLSLAEVKFLKQDIDKPGLSATLLEKRIRSVYRLCMRLYVSSGDEKQEHALQKLLAPQPNIRKQALNLVENKLQADING